MKLLWNGETVELEQIDASEFLYKRNVRKSANYALLSENDFVVSPDTLNFALEVIPDAYPLIRVEEFKDTNNINMLYFRGFVKDDYGFTKLQFVYEIKSSEETDSNIIKKYRLDIDTKRQKQDFYHYLDLATLNLKPGDELTYYFRVWDNDRINGAKSSKSRILSYRVPSPEELAQQKEERAKDLQNKLNETRERAQRINKEMDRLSKKLAEKKNLDWQDKEALKNLLEQYNDLLKDLEKLQKQNQEKQIKDQQFSEEDERIIEKQKQLNELMDKLMTPEMKEMMEEMRKMMEEEMKKEDAQEMLEKLKIENKDIEKQLDRDL
jgi:DNA repair exonuclease SbcCD ATPase subunit